MKQGFAWLKTGLKFSFAFIIIWYMVYSGRLDLSIVQKGFSHGATIVCILLIVFSASLTFYRWLLLAKGQGVFFSYFQVLRYGLIGCFFNTTMPGAVSGDLIKAWHVMGDRKGQEKTPVFTSILLDRMIGVFGLVIVSAMALLFSWSTTWSDPKLQKIAIFVLCLALGVLFFFFYVMFSVWGPFAVFRKKLVRFEQHKVFAVFLKAYDALLSYRENPLILVQSLLLAVFTHLAVVMTVIFCAEALGEAHLAFHQYFLIVPLGLLTTAIPIAPAGLGVGHVAFGELFSSAGSSHGAEIFTLFVSLQILINMTGVFFYIRSPRPVQMAS